MSKDYKIETIFNHAYRHSVEAKTTHTPFQTLSMIPLGYIRDLEKEITKKVQRREIESKICGLNYVLIEHQDKLDDSVISDINKTIKSLESQLKEL